jgi:serine/threonine protein phosphatase PrpC
MKPFAVQVALRTCTGSRSENEDCIAVDETQGRWCLVLSDGAGGHNDGARAARLVVERVLSGFRSRPPADPADLSELLLDAHDAVVAGQQDATMTDSLSAMHATVVVLSIDASAGVALWGHVGDSRLYQWRAGQLTAVTRDDSVFQAIIDTGWVDETRLKTPNRSVLMAALGSAEEAVPHVSEPSALKVSDAFLLCSDGWWGGLDQDIMSNLLVTSATPQDWLDSMEAVTLKIADPRQDNYSAIACWIGEPRENSG